MIYVLAMNNDNKLNLGHITAYNYLFTMLFYCFSN